MQERRRAHARQERHLDSWTAAGRARGGSLCAGVSSQEQPCSTSSSGRSCLWHGSWPAAGQPAFSPTLPSQRAAHISETTTPSRTPYASAHTPFCGLPAAARTRPSGWPLPVPCLCPRPGWRPSPFTPPSRSAASFAGMPAATAYLPTFPIHGPPPFCAGRTSSSAFFPSKFIPRPASPAHPLSHPPPAPLPPAISCSSGGGRALRWPLQTQKTAYCSLPPS